MRAPEQLWSNQEELKAGGAVDARAAEPCRDVSSLLDQVKAGLTPVDEYLDEQAARSAAAAVSSNQIASAVYPASAADEQPRPPATFQPQTEPPLRSADAALLASATRRAYPHASSCAAAQEQQQAAGIRHLPSAPDFSEPATRSQVPNAPTGHLLPIACIKSSSSQEF